MEQLPPLTHLEARVLAAIERHIRAEQQAPTIAELAGILRLKSRGTVHRYVQSLIAKGRLERQGNGWRRLRIVGLAMPEPRSNIHPFPVRRADSGVHSGADHDDHSDDGSDSSPVDPPASASASNIADYRPLPDADDPSVRGNESLGVPLIGRIAAGQPIEAVEDSNWLDLSAFLVGPDRYALRVTGDSMIDAGILDGDTVILRKQDTANAGDIVVALIDMQEATLKRLGRTGNGMVELIPENSTMAPMIYSAERVSFQGVLVGQLRHY